MSAAVKNRVMITNKQKEVKIPTGIRMLVRRCCNAVLIMEKFPYSAEISVSFVDNAQIRVLNRQFRNRDMSTDVLSFPLSDGDKYDFNPETGAAILGDIVISVPTALEQASTYGHDLQREIGYLTCHSMLHLLGYDHENNGIEAVHMREKEEYVMQQLGLPRNASYVMEDDDKL